MYADLMPTLCEVERLFQIDRRLKRSDLKIDSKKPRVRKVVMRILSVLATKKRKPMQKK